MTPTPTPPSTPTPPPTPTPPSTPTPELSSTVERRVTLILVSLIALDLTISFVAFVFPQLWFRVFHGVDYVDPEGLLRRMGANWAAFALLQIVAWKKWRAQPYWLAIVAGARFGDGLPDWTYLAFAHDLTWFARLSLFAASPMNWLAGALLVKCYLVLRRDQR